MYCGETWGHLQLEQIDFPMEQFMTMSMSKLMMNHNTGLKSLIFFACKSGPEQSNDILQSPASFLNDGRSRNDLVIYCSQAKQFFHPTRITVRQADYEVYIVRANMSGRYVFLYIASPFTLQKNIS